MYYRPRHAKKESIFTILFTLFMIVCISGIVIVSIFGSWEKFVIEVVEVVPCGEILFKTIARLLNTGLDITDNGHTNMVGSIIEDCVKLLLASMLLPIAKYFTGAYNKGKHAADPTITDRIFMFLTDKIVVPLVVAVVAAWLVEYMSGLFWDLGGIWAWILSIFGTLTTVSLFVWAFCALAAKGLLWGIFCMLIKLVPAVLSALFSYTFIFLLLIIVGSPEYVSALGPVAVILLGLIIVLSAVIGKTDDFFERY